MTTNLWAEKELVSIVLDDDGGTAKVVRKGDNYIVYWEDGVVNEWEEVYPDLSSAIARLALLEATTHAGRCGFASDDPKVFHKAWQHFCVDNVEDW